MAAGCRDNDAGQRAAEAVRHVIDAILWSTATRLGSLGLCDAVFSVSELAGTTPVNYVINVLRPDDPRIARLAGSYLNNDHHHNDYDDDCCADYDGARRGSTNVSTGSTDTRAANIHRLTADSARERHCGTGRNRSDFYERNRRILLIPRKRVEVNHVRRRYRRTAAGLDSRRCARIESAWQRAGCFGSGTGCWVIERWLGQPSKAVDPATVAPDHVAVLRVKAAGDRHDGVPRPELVHAVLPPSCDPNSAATDTGRVIDTVLERAVAEHVMDQAAGGDRDAVPRLFDPFDVALHRALVALPDTTQIGGPVDEGLATPVEDAQRPDVPRCIGTGDLLRHVGSLRP